MTTQPLRVASVEPNVSLERGRFVFTQLVAEQHTMQLVPGLKALANPTRLRVLELLRNPTALDGAPTGAGRTRGLTGKALLKQLKCSQPALNEQMQILIDLGLVERTKVGRWVVYTRDEERIRQLKQTIIDQLLPP